MNEFQESFENEKSVIHKKKEKVAGTRKRKIISRKTVKRQFYNQVNERAQFENDRDRFDFWRYWVHSLFVEDDPRLNHQANFLCSHIEKRQAYRITSINEINRIYSIADADKIENLINKFSGEYKQKFMHFHALKKCRPSFKPGKRINQEFINEVNSRIGFKRKDKSKKKSFWSYYAFYYFVHDNPVLKQMAESVYKFESSEPYIKSVHNQIGRDEINRFYSIGDRYAIEQLVYKFSVDYKKQFDLQYIYRKKTDHSMKIDQNIQANPKVCMNFENFAELVYKKAKISDLSEAEKFWQFAFECFVKDEDIPIFYHNESHEHQNWMRAKYVPEYIDDIFKFYDEFMYDSLVKKFVNYKTKMKESFFF
jgi:hypothetical protein